MATTGSSLDAMARALSENEDFRVLRRLKPRPTVDALVGQAVRQGVFVDVETTGLDASTDEIIELAMVPFAYTLAGEVLSVGEPLKP